MSFEHILYTGSYVRTGIYSQGLYSLGGVEVEEIYIYIYIVVFILEGLQNCLENASLLYGIEI